MLKKLHLLFALLCAAAMSQFPEFHQQYTQRLGGALDELTLQLDDLDRRAEAAGMGRFDYVRHFQNNSDEVVRGEGDAMMNMLSRHSRLSKAYQRLEEAPWYMSFIETAFHLEPDLAENTMMSFVPAIPLSISGGAHAFFGFFFGYLIPAFLRSLFPRRVPKTA